MLNRLPDEPARFPSLDGWATFRVHERTAQGRIRSDWRPTVEPRAGGPMPGKRAGVPPPAYVFPVSA
jgi:hypothetical protein